MTIRISTGLRNALAHGLGFGGALSRGSIEIYSGSQPATADAAVTGTLLGVVTASSLALTKETQASQTITVAGSAGSINTVTVGTFNIIPDGAVPFRTDAATTAADLCDAINRNGIYTASVSGAVVTIKPRPGVGAAHNAYVVATTVTTLTATSGGNMAGGVNNANGLVLGLPAAGVVSKSALQTWSFSGLAAGTAGWFRFVGSVADGGAALSAAPWLVRMDGSVAASGGDMNLSNITIASGAPNTIDAFTFTVPAN
jgi:hypothetical protein